MRIIHVARHSGNKTTASVFGSDEDDFLVGTPLQDFIYGGDGNDRFRGGEGADYLYGEAGRDEVRGEDGDDILSGGEGNDALRGGRGNDILRSEAGIDLLEGGTGSDRISFFTTAATAGAIVDLTTQTVENDGFGNRETLTSIEDVGLGTLFTDVFLGSDDTNFLWIDAGDTALGRGGDDVIRVGSVAGTTIDGGAGFDGLTVDGGTAQIDGNGQLTLIYAPDGVIVDLGRERMIDGFGNSARIAGFEYVTGSNRADRVRGSEETNILDGANGDDRLFGLGGTDFLTGGVGDDVVDGGDGDDQLRGGDALDDVVPRDAGADILRGGAGDDYLDGGAGTDRLFGGVGSDAFFFDAEDSGTTLQTADRIRDFSQVEEDRIIIAIESGQATFIGINAFSGAVGEVRYEARNGETIVFMEADGQEGVDLILRLTGEFTLTASDFSL